jgi:hypothetical protein
VVVLCRVAGRERVLIAVDPELSAGFIYTAENWEAVLEAR